MMHEEISKESFYNDFYWMKEYMSVEEWKILFQNKESED
jgi:hypothetical protein